MKFKKKQKKIKAFTLVELLAVIAILALLLLIIVPKVNDVLKDSKHSVNKSSTLSLGKTADLYYSKNIGNSDINKTFDGETNILDNLNVSGKKPESGYVLIDEDGNVSVGAVFNNTCYIKGFDEDEASIVDDISKCTYVKVDKKLNIIKESDNIVETENYLGGTDYRYNGPTVNNYVTFSGQSWRIIGFINDKVKLIKNDSIGVYKWNEHLNNDWVTSSLNAYLNGEFYNSLSDKDMIDTVNYKLGGINTTDTTVENLYNMENGTTVYSGRPLEITNTKIALMYPSDYGYSMDSSCTENPFYYDTTDACKSAGTWLYNVCDGEWLLSHDTKKGSTVSFVSSINDLYVTSVFYYKEVRPSLYLKFDVKITGGTGTSSDPYTLSM